MHDKNVSRSFVPPSHQVTALWHIGAYIFISFKSFDITIVVTTSKQTFNIKNFTYHVYTFKCQVRQYI